MYHALPYIRHRRTLSVSLPNAANIGFDYSYAIVVIMISYIPREFMTILTSSVFTTLFMCV